MDNQTKTPAEIAIDIAKNPYAWLGGYPKYAITDDGAVLCKDCCRTEIECIAESFPSDGWHVIAADINWEDSHLNCDHCGNIIESAYGDNNESSEVTP